MAVSPEAAKNLPSQENLLLDYVHRLEKHREGRKVVHVHLSQLRPFNRREQHIRAATSSFEPLIGDMLAQLFSLRNADIILAYKAEVQAQVETTVQKVRFLFSDDPLIADKAEHGKPFATWFDAEEDYDAILKLVQELAEEEVKMQTQVRSRMDARAALKAKQERGEPMTPEVLGRVETAISRADLSNYVRRQFVCEIDSQNIPTQLFSELFISISDLRETLMPGVNLASNRWLFQHLTETLDGRMLSMLSKTDAITITGEISINVNMKTLLSDDFQSFDDNISASRRGSMIIELQKEDIFSDLSAYLFAREFVQERGYRLLLDGLTMGTMFVIDREKLGCDMVKLVWTPEFLDASGHVLDRLKEMAASGGGSRLIFCRCDSRESVDFGRSIGAKLFQGRYVETLIAEDNRRRELLRLKHRIQRASVPIEGEEEEDGLL